MINKNLHEIKSKWIWITGLIGVQLLFMYSVGIGQNSTVSGTVTDAESGETLPGVNITVKGTTIGTATDYMGTYSLNVSSLSDTLVFSFVGYQTKEIPTNGRTEIDIELALQTVAGDEVVVVGYGSQRKSDLTGSISSVKAEEITQLSTQRVDQALQGRSPGMMVLNTDGAPGGNTTIRIRGMNSIQGGNDALIVIDGLQGGDLNSLNPNDIESIEILKDASATAIYGSRGANGVILITTKQGTIGRPVINYNYSIGAQKLNKKIDVMNAADFARTANTYIATQNGSGNVPPPFFSDTQIAEFEANGGTDWQDEIFRTAILQNHQLSVSGGTENLTYFVSGGYLANEGILVNSAYKRFSLRATLNADVSESVSFNLTWNGSNEVDDIFATSSRAKGIHRNGNPINAVPRWAATEPVYDADGSYHVHGAGYGAGGEAWNPMASSLEPMIDNNTIRNALKGDLEFKILEGLNLKVAGGAIVRNINNQMYHNVKTIDGTRAGNGLGNRDERVIKSYQNTNILTYDREFDAHHFTFTAVAELQYEEDHSSQIEASNFLTDQTGVWDLASAGLSTIASSASERSLNSYLGRINYVLDDKYLLTASYRADGSSVFGADNKWGYFPSVAVAWRLSEEQFIQNLDLFSDLKLRGSWGITGNQGISPYQTLPRLQSGATYPYNGGESSEIGFQISSATNPSLKWESTTQTNFGVDLELFDGGLSATFDYYKKITEDLLMDRPLPEYTGFSSVLDNVGSIENKGWEISVGGFPVTGEFQWNTNFNISTNRSNVLELGGEDRVSFGTGGGGYFIDDDFMYLVEGEPFGQMYGYGVEGTWNEDEAEQAAIYGQLPGDQKYTDVNNDGIIDSEDIKVVGNSMPKVIFGWSNQLFYKDFDLAILVQGTQGNDVFNMERILLERPEVGNSTRLLDRWTPENQDTDVPAFIDELTRQNAGLTSTINAGYAAFDQRTSRWVEDASYVRLKNITLSYNLPVSLTNKINFRSAKVYVSADNLLTLTKYSGYNPEVSSFNSNDAEIGVDFGNYPSSRILTFGIDVSF